MPDDAAVEKSQILKALGVGGGVRGAEAWMAEVWMDERMNMCAFSAIL